MGFSVKVATLNKDIEGYTTVNGTSFSAPLVAGAVALLLEQNPTWTPKDVRKALTKTGSQSKQADNLLGYGVVDAYKALNVGSSKIESTFDSLSSYPNPFEKLTQLEFFSDRDRAGEYQYFQYPRTGSLQPFSRSSSQPVGFHELGWQEQVRTAGCLGRLYLQNPTQGVCPIHLSSPRKIGAL